MEVCGCAGAPDKVVAVVQIASGSSMFSWKVLMEVSDKVNRLVKQENMVVLKCSIMF